MGQIPRNGNIVGVLVTKVDGKGDGGGKGDGAVAKAIPTKIHLT